MALASDLYGAIDVSGAAYFCRWRGSPPDFARGYDLIYGNTGPLPRPPDGVPNERFGEIVTGGGSPGDMIGGWADRGAEVDTVLSRLDEKLKAGSRTFLGLPTVPLQSPSTNNNGTSINSYGQQAALWIMVSADTLSDNEVTLMRQCVLQFARDVGLDKVETIP